jgi:hypothetical protein
VIGWVEFVEAGVVLKAVLDDMGRWNCEAAPHIAELLDRGHPPSGDQADDDWGLDALIEAALKLNGIAWLNPGRAAD